MNWWQNKINIFGLNIFLASTVLMTGCVKNKPEPVVPITVKAELDHSVVEIGDKLKYTIIIQKDKDIEIEPVAFNQSFGNFALLDFGSKKSASFKQEKISQWYILDTYITGKTTFPKVTIKYKRKKDKDWNQINSGEVSVEVKSSLDKTKANIQMRDIKDPVSMPSTISKYFIFAGGLLLVVLGLSVGYFLKKNKAKIALPKKPAHEIAYQQLKQLQGKDYIRRGLIKEYYTEISDIIRHYLENRFSLRAPEMTTEEFLLRAKDAAELIREHKQLLKEFLLCCDLVKFAKYAPSTEEINYIFDSAENFIGQTKENDPA